MIPPRSRPIGRRKPPIGRAPTGRVPSSPIQAPADSGTRLAATLAAAALAAAPAQASHARSPCLAAAARTEAALGIPAHLLSAIALAESGPWDHRRKETIAWPWTIYAEGRARSAPSKARAVVEVKRLRARGVRNIDVGCMQVNLHYPSGRLPLAQRS